MRILIIKISALGDIIHALPVLDYLHQASPGVQIDWVVEEAFHDLLSGNPLIQHIIPVAFKRWKKSPLRRSTLEEIWGLRTRLQASSYDIVFDLQGNLKSGLVCGVSRAARKVGFSKEHQQERLNGFFTNSKVSFLPSDTNAVPRYLRVVSAPFSLVPEAVEPYRDIYTTAEDNSYAQGIIDRADGTPVLLFHTGTTWATKFWYADAWRQLAYELFRRYPDAKILLSWGNQAEQLLAQQLAEQIGERAFVLEKLSLKAFAAVLKLVDLVVGGDTGPVHLAAAVGTPTVSFYRSSDGTASGPQGSCHLIVQSPLACTRCFRTSCPRDDECRASITVEAMMSAVEKALTAVAESPVKPGKAGNQVAPQ